MTEEVWREIPSAPAYEASSLGRIRRVTPAFGTYAGLILRPSINGKGYLYVVLSENSITSTRTVHVLVCEAFRGPRPSPTHHAAHDDGVPLNVQASNLFWKTPKENAADKSRHGTQLRGHEHIDAKLSKDQLADLRMRFAANERTVDLARRFGVTESTISSIKYGRRYKRDLNAFGGTRALRAKLDDNSVRAIRKMRSDGKRLAEIASTFIVSEACVRKVLLRKTWGHVQ